MFDTMTLTKIVGGFCGALLIFLLGGWAAEALYHTGGGHGEGEGAHGGYVIATADDGGHAAEAEEEVSFEELLAAADVAKGEKAFSKCKACHKVDGSNSTGPYLNGVVDRAVGSVAGFGYSGALVAVADVWTAENLDGFLENPKGFAPGTKMSFSGLPKAEDRANLVAYLASLGG
ncbi:c-type cytochrome [Actibacterium sp. XHP0104]|uniref:c-type cytochrome n=1 Tax=Actibacterium sp. XHP0104 TaxID=2984335 RepID=UPI0021E6DAC9|nr:cytochrome c family protein [Actibacterium sp. XHP0104]MCV2882828.1 cytochrome c family protein [Actibacterium sp. XHP0104]